MTASAIEIPTRVPDLRLKEIQVRQWEPQEVDAFSGLLDQHHYLKAPEPLQCGLRQVFTYQGQPVALVIWTNAAYHLRPREALVGWDPRTRSRRLHFVVQQSRFCLLPRERVPNLASRVLALSVQHLGTAWQERHGVRPLLAETFVDPEQFAGRCYRAAGWFKMDQQTAGYSRDGRDYYTSNNHPKDLWMKPLDGDALALLRDPSRKLPGEKARAPGMLPVKCKQAESLYDALCKVPDPRGRRGRQFPLGALLTGTVLALASGAQNIMDIFRFIQDLKPAQRRALGLRSNREAPQVVPPPSYQCIYKVLRALDPEALAQALSRWQAAYKGQLPALLSIDGKVIGHNLATLVSLVEAEDGSPVHQEAAQGNGQEQALAKKTFEHIEQGQLEGKTVAGDALYTHRELARKLVQDHGAHYLTQVKDNQPTVSAQAERLLRGAPPF